MYWLVNASASVRKRVTRVKPILTAALPHVVMAHVCAMTKVPPARGVMNAVMVHAHPRKVVVVNRVRNVMVMLNVVRVSVNSHLNQLNLNRNRKLKLNLKPLRRKRMLKLLPNRLPLNPKLPRKLVPPMIALTTKKLPNPPLPLLRPLLLPNRPPKSRL